MICKIDPSVWSSKVMKIKEKTFDIVENIFKGNDGSISASTSTTKINALWIIAYSMKTALNFCFAQ